MIRHPLDDMQFKAADVQPDIALSDVRGKSFCQLMARRGMADTLAQRMGISTGAGVSSVTDAWAALPLSPGQWLLIGDGGRDGDFTRRVTERAGDAGYASEQSHARNLIRIQGLLAYDVLAKGIRLDLDPLNTPVGYVAQTVAAQVGVTLHKLDEQPTFDLIVYAGYAESFWHWLVDASEEYTVDTVIVDQG
jgi:heterotetrameric sarcosine oxidase gamma subunit